MFRRGTWKRRTLDAIDVVLRTPRFHRVRNPVSVALALMSERDQALFIAVRGCGLPKFLAGRMTGLSRGQVTTRLRRSEKLVLFVADALLVREIQGVVGRAWQPRSEVMGRVG